MAIFIIYLFQFIHIHQGHGDDFVLLPGCFHTPCKHFLSCPAVINPCQFIRSGFSGKLFIFCDIRKVAHIIKLSVPLRPAVIMPVNMPGPGIMLIPHINPAFCSFILYMAERTFSRHPLLQQFPAGTAFRMLQMKLLFHSFIHIYNRIRIHIQNINIGLQPVKNRRIKQRIKSIHFSSIHKAPSVIHTVFYIISL